MEDIVFSLEQILEKKRGQKKKNLVPATQMRKETQRPIANSQILVVLNLLLLPFNSYLPSTLSYLRLIPGLLSFLFLASPKSIESLNQ